MSAPTLIYDQVNPIYPTSPNFRRLNTSDVTSYVVYKINNSETLLTLQGPPNGTFVLYKSNIELVCVGATLVIAEGVANVVEGIFNNSNFNNGADYAVGQHVTSRTIDYIEDSTPGGIDKIRSVILNVTMFHYTP